MKQKHHNVYITLIVLLVNLILKIHTSNVRVNSDGLFEMEDGTTFNYCQDYKEAIGDIAQNGFYKQTNQPTKKMYCLMDGQEWGLYSEYEIFLNRKKQENNIVFNNMSWEQSKQGKGDNNEWWVGFNYIRTKCGGEPNKCDLVFFMRTQNLQPSNTGGYQKIFLNSWNVRSEANQFSYTYESLSAGQYISTAAATTLSYHSNKSFSTHDRNNIGGTCVSEYGCGWFNQCHHTNFFSPFGTSPPVTCSFLGADDSETSTSSQHDAIDIVGFGVRKMNTGGDGIDAYNGIGSIDLGGYKVSCDHTVCATCSGSRTNCILNCNDGCAVCDPTGDCKSCPGGKYLQQGECLQCDNTQCATCLGSNTNCLLNCNQGCVTCFPDQTCDLCDDGKWSENGVCSGICDNNVCATCRTSATDCIKECNSDCKTCDIDGTCISCNDGTFLDNGLCKSCDNTQCATCENSSQECLTICNSTCKTCLPDQTCETCEDGQWLNSDQCDNYNSSVCGTCNTSATDCILQCNSDCQTCNIDGTCKSCDDGKFLEDGWCKSCDNTKCATCQNTSQECILICNSTCKTCLPDQTCETCNDGKWRDVGVCKNCISPNCLCSINEQCDECFGSYIDYRILPNCSCIQGYFQNDQGLCEQCSQSCITCTQKNECEICINGNGRTLQPPQCGCQQQYYLDKNQNTCESCPSQCKTCNDQKQCTSCIETQDGKILKLPYCKEAMENLQTAFISFSVDIQGNQIESQGICDKKCESCQQQSNNCTTCRIDQNRNNNPPGCNCLQGYHDNQGQLYYCEKCNPLCFTCNNKDQCLSCYQEDNRYLNPYNLTCVCKKGYFESSNKICQKCYQYQGKCIAKCPLNTYLEHQTSSCIFKDYKLVYQKQTIFIVGMVILIFSFIIKTILSFIVQKNLKIQEIQQQNKESIQVNAPQKKIEENNL